MELPQSITRTPVYSYTRTDFRSLRTKTSLFSLSVVDRLKDLDIGYYLPRRHRSSRGVVVVVVVELPQAPEDDPQKR